jgi:hypothetical protein
MTVSQTQVGRATTRKASHGREPFGCHCRPGTRWGWRSRRPTSGRIRCRKDQEGSTIAVDSGGRPDRPACSSRSLEPARSRSRTDEIGEMVTYGGFTRSSVRRGRLRFP